MFDNHILLSYFLLLLISAGSVYANEHNDALYQENKIAADRQSVPIQTAPLNLTVDPNIIEDSKKQQETIRKKNNPILPNVFKDQQTEKDVSMESGLLIKDEAIDPGAVDGAEINIKVKTD